MIWDRMMNLSTSLKKASALRWQLTMKYVHQRYLVINMYMMILGLSHIWCDEKYKSSTPYDKVGKFSAPTIYTWTFSKKSLTTFQVHTLVSQQSVIWIECIVNTTIAETDGGILNDHEKQRIFICLQQNQHQCSPLGTYKSKSFN